VKTRILTRAEIERLVTMEHAVAAVEGAFRAHGANEALMPAKVYLDLPRYGGDFRAMPAHLEGSAGVKWVNSHPQNPERHGLPAVMGVFILSDPDTAVPLAVMDFTYLTAVRTGAAGAVASKHLARGGARSLGFVGCGVQARFLLDAHRAVLPSLDLKMADVDPQRAQRFAAEAGGRAVSLEEACGCDIVCTATPSRAPVVERAWIRPGAHVNAMGADAPGKQELDPALLDDGVVIIDEAHQAESSGEINMPLNAGRFARERIHGTLGEVLVGTLPGRRTDDEITIFDSTGLAIQDLALARLVYELARERGIGTELDLVSS
jgi:alanine dehydrogenase